MANYTRTQLEQQYPRGTVKKQINHETLTLTDEEWNEWIESQVGKEIPVEDEEP